MNQTFNDTDQDAVILAILSPGSQSGPFTIDVSQEPPWSSLRPDKTRATS
jgi:hypothetical protein